MDVITGNIKFQPLGWWEESTPPVENCVKVTENLGAAAIIPVAPVDTSLTYDEAVDLLL